MASILVIDGNRAVSAAIRLLLEDEGFHVIVARTGEAGLDALESTRLDLMVPDLGWLETRASISSARSAVGLPDHRSRRRPGFDGTGPVRHDRQGGRVRRGRHRSSRQTAQGPARGSGGPRDPASACRHSGSSYAS